MQDDFEKSEFEKDWQKAFKDAEIKPWRTSWDSVKNELNAIHAEKTRHTFFIFLRYTAVACFLLAVGLFSAYWYKGSEGNIISTLDDNKEKNKKVLYIVINNSEWRK